MAIEGPERKTRQLLAGWLLAAALGAAAAFMPHTGLLELKLLDQGFRWSRQLGVLPAPDAIAIVGVDDATLQAFPEPFALWHHYLATLVTGIAAVEPKAIGVDIELPERSYEFVRAGGDRELLQGLIAARAVPLVVARGIDHTGKVKTMHAPFLAVLGDAGTGLAVWPLDRDLRVRRFDERLAGADAPVNTLVGALLRQLGLEPRAGVIDFSRGEQYDYLPAHEVYAWIRAGDSARLTQALSRRVVLIGSVLSFTDRHTLPVPLARWEQDLRVPGVLIHAQALRSFMAEGPLRAAPAWSALLLVVAASLAWFACARLRIGLAIVGCACLAMLAGWLALLRAGVHLPVVAALSTAALAAAGRIAYEAWFQRRERARLKSSFEGYVSPNVLERILRGDLDSEIASGRRMLCVMFADVRNFTPRSEHAVPEHVVTMLNLYFERMTGAIHAHQGTVDNFRGDGIMCFFGAPLPTANPCLDGFGAARAMVGQLDGLNRELVRLGIEPIAIGVSLAFGEAIVGRIGAGARHEYTAIGDVANVSARIEGLTKEFGYPLIVSDAVVGELGKSAAEFDDLGMRELKGHAPVRIYGWPARESDARKQLGGLRHA